MRHISYAILIAAAWGCGTEAEVTQPPMELHHGSGDRRYDVTKFEATLGGSPNVGTSINDRGWVAGFANLSPTVRHAALWRDGQITNLGTLGSPDRNSNVQWPGLNDRGMIVGIAEMDSLDPRNENWSCASFLPASTPRRICRGFLWENGTMTALPTLGGTHGFATSINNWGQAVGWTETLVEDSTCSAPQVLQFRAVMWEKRWGRIRIKELRPLRGDSASAATGINDRGQAVGISGECDDAVGDRSATHAVLWEDGRPRNIGDLGGEFWHTPMDINDDGVVVGFGNPAGVVGGALRPHAFIWTRRGGIKDLGTLPGDSTSQAFAVNAWGDVVGRSCLGALSGCRAVLWRNRTIVELETLVPAEFAATHNLSAARDVNDDGVITGNLVELSTGRTLVFTAKPAWRTW